MRLVLFAWARGDFRSEADWLDPEITFETFMPAADETVVAHGSDELYPGFSGWTLRGEKVVKLSLHYDETEPSKPSVSKWDRPPPRRSHSAGMSNARLFRMQAQAADECLPANRGDWI